MKNKEVHIKGRSAQYPTQTQTPQNISTCVKNEDRQADVQQYLNIKFKEMF